MFLHLIHPDPKFPPLIRRLFEAAVPGAHVYVLLGNGGRIPRVWEGFQVVEEPEALAQLLRELGDLDGVTLNGVLLRALPYIGLIPDHVPMGWNIWGFELYEHLHGGGLGAYGPSSRRYLNDTLIQRFKNAFRPAYWKLLGFPRQTSQVLQRLSYVVTQLPAEFELLQRRGLLPVTCRHVELPVIQLEDLVDEGSDRRLGGGEDIQVGNSADLSNNHLEVFQVLRDFDLDGRRVFVPLSYGDPAYRDFILAQGRKMLGGAFQPITELLPLKHYLALLDSCSLVIMNHYRQQALGNIIGALWRGARVYLGPSATYTTYREWGLSVFPFDQSFTFPASGWNDVNKISEKNRRILKAHLGGEVVLPRLSSWLTDMKNKARKSGSLSL